MKASDVKKELQSVANPEKALLLQGFFKTGEGEYGEGDLFLGITVPQQRAIATPSFQKLDSWRDGVRPAEKSATSPKRTGST